MKAMNYIPNKAVSYMLDRVLNTFLSILKKHVYTMFITDTGFCRDIDSYMQIHTFGKLRFVRVAALLLKFSPK